MDKSAPVASAVLVSAMHLLAENMETVKRWTSEIQEVVQSKNGMVQYHAVAVLHALRSRDRLAVSKLVSSLVRGNVRSPMAQCLLVRYVAQVRHPPPGDPGSFRVECCCDPVVPLAGHCGDACRSSRSRARPPVGRRGPSTTSWRAACG